MCCSDIDRGRRLRALCGIRGIVQRAESKSRAVLNYESQMDSYAFMSRLHARCRLYRHRPVSHLNCGAGGSKGFALHRLFHDAPILSALRGS